MAARAVGRPNDRMAPVVVDLRDRFAAYVAHELRTSVALQLALAEAALADPDAEDRAWRAMGEAIVAGCEEQRRLIDSLLDLTCSQRGPKCREPVDIAALTGRALAAHDLSELDSVLALEPAVATGDPILLERLVANLVSNAIRHNVPHGRIEVVTRTGAGRARLSLANTGPLIPAGELGRLFQPFERLAGRAQAHGGGVGLGLAVVQSIADAHDAAVGARARAGGGLEVEVSFPASGTPPQPDGIQLGLCRPEMRSAS